MSYYSRPGDDKVDDFDEFDPTPYGCGYNIYLQYGRPLPPSKETCYPSSTPSDGDFNYTRRNCSSYAEPSAYGDEVLQNEYSSYARPKPRPGVGGGYESNTREITASNVTLGIMNHKEMDTAKKERAQNKNGKQIKEISRGITSKSATVILINAVIKYRFKIIANYCTFPICNSTLYI
ncbi:hypothetical protein SLE2022_011660 [Rubroshorea leprosula]